MGNTRLEMHALKYMLSTMNVVVMNFLFRSCVYRETILKCGVCDNIERVIKFIRSISNTKVSQNLQASALNCIGPIYQNNSNLLLGKLVEIFTTQIEVITFEC